MCAVLPFQQILIEFVPVSDPSGHNDYFALLSIVLLVTCLSVCNWGQNRRSDRGPFLELIRSFEGNEHIIFHRSKILITVINTSSVTILFEKCCGTQHFLSEVNFC